MFSISFPLLGNITNGVLVTGKGNLPCKKHIIHMVAPISKEVKPWSDGVFACLQEAEKLKLESISFPAIGTGMLLNALLVQGIGGYCCYSYSKLVISLLLCAFKMHFHRENLCPIREYFTISVFHY